MYLSKEEVTKIKGEIKKYEYQLNVLFNQYKLNSVSNSFSTSDLCSKFKSKYPDLCEEPYQAFLDLVESMHPAILAKLQRQASTLINIEAENKERILTLYIYKLFIINVVDGLMRELLAINHLKLSYQSVFREELLTFNSTPLEDTRFGIDFFIELENQRIAVQIKPKSFFTMQHNISQKSKIFSQMRESKIPFIVLIAEQNQVPKVLLPTGEFLDIDYIILQCATNAELLDYLTKNWLCFLENKKATSKEAA